MKTVRIPSDIDQDDKLLAGLTARQLVIVGLPVIALWFAYAATRRMVPITVFGPIAVIVAGAVFATAVARRDGISMDRFIGNAVGFSRSPKKLLNIEESVVLPATVGRFGLPVEAIHVNGIVDLGSNGSCVLSEVAAVNLALQSEAEQEALTAAFGRFCNALSGHLQIVVRCEPVELGVAASAMDELAGSLATIGLEAAAHDHAAFLRSLEGRSDLQRRRVYVVLLSSRNADVVGAALLRDAQEALRSLRAAGLDGRVLNGAEVASILQSPMQPVITHESVSDVERVTRRSA